MKCESCDLREICERISRENQTARFGRMRVKMLTRKDLDDLGERRRT